MYTHSHTYMEIYRNRKCPHVEYITQTIHRSMKYTFEYEKIYMYAMCPLNIFHQKNALFSNKIILSKSTTHGAIKNLKQSSRLDSLCNL